MKAYFEGGYQSYSFAKKENKKKKSSSPLYDVLNLSLGNREEIQSGIIRAFDSIEELALFVNETNNLPLKGFISVVRTYGEELKPLMKQLKSSVVGSADEADIVFSTVHKAKGMEYDKVELLEDFCSEENLVELGMVPDNLDDNILDFYNEEVNLLYVAATRSRGIIKIPKSLVPASWKPVKGATDVQVSH